jgi:3-methyladenine DNA glycosylase AlkD
VPVALIEVVRKGAAVAPLLDTVEPLMMDGERVVQQGVGWFLREAWKREPAPVEQILLRYKDSAPRLIFQYATEKMTPKARERFRRAK